MKTLLGSALGVLALLAPSALAAPSLSLSGIFLGEPDIFVPGLGVSIKFPFTRSLNGLAGAALFLSGSWNLKTGVAWPLSSCCSST